MSDIFSLILNTPVEFKEIAYLMFQGGGLGNEVMFEDTHDGIMAFVDGYYFGVDIYHLHQWDKQYWQELYEIPFNIRVSMQALEGFREFTLKGMLNIIHSIQGNAVLNEDEQVLLLRKNGQLILNDDSGYKWEAEELKLVTLPYTREYIKRE